MYSFVNPYGYNNQGRRKNDRDAKYDKYGDREQMEAEIEKEAIMLCKAKKLERIIGFTGYFDFMNLEYMTPVYFEGALYPSGAHAYHAAKSFDDKIRRRFQKMPMIKEMQLLAQTLQEPEDWKMRRLAVMEIVNRDKFRRNKELREKLDSTLDRELVNEITDENDREDSLFWGVIKDQGQNQLGRIIEKIRRDMRENKELEKWVCSSFKLQEDRKAIPFIKFNVYKSNELIEKVELEGRAFCIFGSSEETSDVVMLHPSISRTHAILIVDSDSNVQLIDPGSKAGTKIDDELMKNNFPYTLKNDQVIQFGESTRTYKAALDYSRVSKSFELEKARLEKDLKIMEKLEGENIDIDTLHKSLGINKNDTVWVGNLIPSITEEDLRDIFEDCGKIVSIRIPEDKFTRQKKGFAFITFDNENAAKNALLRDGVPLFKKFLKVLIAENKSDLEFKDRKQYEEKKDYRRRSRERDRRRNSSSNDSDDKRRKRNKEKEKGRRNESPENYRDFKKKKIKDQEHKTSKNKNRSSSSNSASSSFGSSNSSSSSSSSKRSE